MIKNVENFVFLDDVKFIKREWKNRNRIRKSKNSNEYKWLTVPIIKESQNYNINRALINYEENWKISHINSISEVYKTAPYFSKYSQEIFQIINNNYKFLSELNIELIKYISKNFNFNI